MVQDRKRQIAALIAGAVGLLVLAERGGPMFSSFSQSEPASPQSPVTSDDPKKARPVANDQSAPDPLSPKPRAIVQAKGLGLVPGAIVCPNYQTAHDVYDQYVASLEDSIRYGIANAQTHGHARELYGDPPDKFDFESYGCQLIPNGQTVELLGYIYDQIPIVRVKSGQGGVMKGVTLPGMVSQPNP